jgi:hypothetical protein
MKRPLFISVSIALIGVLTTCGLSACGKTEPKTNAAQPPPKVEETVFGGLVGTKEKARVDTEKAMEKNQKNLEEAMKKNDPGAAQ